MKLPRTANIVIIGSGIMGLSTAYHLARHGCRQVVVLEKEDTLGGQTTKSCGGGIRHQFSEAITIRMSQLGIQMLKGLMHETGETIRMDQCGYMFLLTTENELREYQQVVQLQRQFGIATEWLSTDDVREHVPILETNDILGGTFYAQDGWISPEDVVKAYLTALQRLGVTCITSLAVEDLRIKKGRICEVVTSQGAIVSPIVVNAAGPYAAQIGRMANVNLPIRPVRHQMLIYERQEVLKEYLPVILFPSQNIGFRSNQNDLTAGTTVHHEEPLDRSLQVDQILSAQLHMRALKYIPSLQATSVKKQAVGLYEITPDSRPILGRIPDVEGFYCIAGFNGHGFMHGANSGLLLSEELIEGKAHTLNIEPLRPERFAL